MKIVYYGKSAQDLSWIHIGLGFEIGGGREGGGVSLYKDFNFLVSQHKAYKTYKQQYGEDYTDIQGAKREISVLFFKPGGENAVCRLYCFSLFFSFFFFKGERHLFSWQRQYSMD